MANREKKYVIKIAPIAWKRPGLSGHRFFDGQQAEKVMFGLHLRNQHKDEPLFDKAIEIDITFYMPTPASKKIKTGIQYHSTIADIDNLTKFVFDAMKSVLITDDRIISILHARKIYAKVPRTEFTIREL